jgi:ankyrin repeat protein
VVQLLLAARANVNTTTADGRTPLVEAATAGHLDMVQLLLQHRADPRVRNAGGNTIIHVAAAAGNKAMVQLLLEAWGDPPVPAADLVIASRAAAAHGHMATFARLLKELQGLYPTELHHVFAGPNPMSVVNVAAAMASEWASDVSSIEEQRAAVVKREQEVASEKAAVQQLIVGVAGMAKFHA